MTNRNIRESEHRDAPSDRPADSTESRSSESAIRVVYRDVPRDAQQQISQNLRIGRQAAARKK